MRAMRAARSTALPRGLRNGRSHEEKGNTISPLLSGPGTPHGSVDSQQEQEKSGMAGDELFDTFLV